MRDLLHDEAFDVHEKAMARYLKPDLLILDDMGINSLAIHASTQSLLRRVLRATFHWPCGLIYHVEPHRVSAFGSVVTNYGQMDVLRRNNP